MIEPILKKLTKSRLRKIDAKDIIYAEIAEGGAMGNAGGILLYHIKDEELICSRTNVFEKQNLYGLAVSLILKHQDKFKTNESEIQEILFDYYYGGMGNHVFINKNVTFEIKETYFIYTVGSADYQIIPSVQGVTESIVQALKKS